VQTSRTMQRRSTLAAQLAALFAAVLVGLAGCGTGTIGEGTTGSAHSPAPGASAVTPGPQARYLRNVVTARGVTKDNVPIDPTSTFQADMPIYLVCVVQGVTPGTSHRLTVRWYLQGQQLQVDGSYAYATLTQNGPISFSMTYPILGPGMARLYWDEPIADNSARPNESFLAQAIAFTVQ
jgi:F0F1-type ATP synthase membrane subunit c/vacuolar-type H+-ATPase subunit K